MERKQVSQTVRSGVDGRRWVVGRVRLQMQRKQCQGSNARGMPRGSPGGR